MNEYLERLDHGDVEDGATRRGARTKNLAEKIAALGEKNGRYQAMLEQLQRTGEDQISLTNPDSRAMAAHTKVAGGYNIEVAVDAKNKLIVERAVTNQVVDMGLLTQTAEPARRQSGDFFTIAQDGLLPKMFSEVHPTLGTPYKSQLLIRVIVAIVGAWRHRLIRSATGGAMCKGGAASCN